jgi:hypothetical protein
VSGRDGCGDPPRPRLVRLIKPHYPKRTRSLDQLSLIEELVNQSLPAGWPIEDSFASLNLAPLGLTTPFEAEWIYLPQEKTEPSQVGKLPAKPRWELVRSEESLAAWEQAWRDANGDTNTTRVFLPSLLDNPDVVVGDGTRTSLLTAGAAGR